jgi:hypothetical protein
MEKVLAVFNSFADADRATKADLWALTPVQRLNMLEALRRINYGRTGTPPGFQRIIEIADFKKD